MALTVDLYAEGDSWLHATDPRAKMLLVGLFGVVVLSVQNLLMLLALVIAVLFVHRSAGTPLERIAFLFRALLPISLLMPLVWVIFYPAGELVVRLWIIQIPILSLFQGLAVVFRIYAVTLAVLALLYTTEQPALVRGLEKLRLPYRWGLVLSLTFRYIPALQLTFESILQAQRARGLEFESKRGIGRVRALMPVFIPMVITTLRDSEQMGIALEARGFGAEATRRTHYRDVSFQWSDWAYLAIGIVTTGMLLFLKIKYGFGADPIRPLP